MVMGASATATLGRPATASGFLLASAIYASLVGCGPFAVAMVSMYVLILDLDLDNSSLRLWDRSCKARLAALSQTSSPCSQDRNFSSGLGYHVGLIVGVVVTVSYWSMLAV